MIIKIANDKLIVITALIIVVLSILMILHIKRAYTLYPNCAAARAAGHSYIPASSRFYNPALDANKNGIACEE